MKKLALHWQILIGMGLGIVWSILSVSEGLGDFTKDWIAPWGEIFIRALKFIAIPLVLFSIISGIVGLPDMSKLGRVGIKTLGIYLTTTVLAITIGLVVVNVLMPGNTVAEEDRVKNRIRYELWVEANGMQYMDDVRLLRDTAHAELVAQISAEAGSAPQNEKLEKIKAQAQETKDQSPLKPLVDLVPENLFVSLSNGALMLQVIFFAILFGVCILLIPSEKTTALVGVINGANEVFVKMVEVVMKASPFFVFCLMAATMSSMAGSLDELFEMFKGLGTYSLTVLLGLAVVMFGVYPTLVKIGVRKMKLGRYLRKISPAQLLAFSTSSSAATLPVTMEVVEEKIGVNKSISSFVLPIGATVNMDGTSLYQAVAVMFLAQLHMVSLGFTDQLEIVLTATLASIGAAAVPGAGLVMLMIVLESVNLNPAWIALVLPVDRLLDMCRTSVNVSGDIAVCTVVAHSEGELAEGEKN
jgi:Na+/H+-dicarboxylate symporter